MKRMVEQISFPQILLPSLAVACAGCGDGSGEQTFYIGWTILGLIVLSLLVLFGGLVRYIRQGAKKETAATHALDYEYTAPDKDDDDPFRK